MSVQLRSPQSFSKGIFNSIKDKGKMDWVVGHPSPYALLRCCQLKEGSPLGEVPTCKTHTKYSKCDQICENRPPCKICTLEIWAFEHGHLVVDPNFFYYTTVILGPLATSWGSLTVMSASVRAL